MSHAHRTLLPSEALDRIKVQTGDLNSMLGDVMENKPGIAELLYRRLQAIHRNVLAVYEELQQDIPCGLEDNSSKREFQREIIEIEVVGEGPSIDEIHPADAHLLTDDLSLQAIVEAMTTGDLSGRWNIVAAHSVNGRQAAQLLAAQGSEPGFLGLDEDGRDVED